jgi:hypothetical protein
VTSFSTQAGQALLSKTLTKDKGLTIDFAKTGTAFATPVFRVISTLILEDGLLLVLTETAD